MKTFSPIRHAWSPCAGKKAAAATRSSTTSSLSAALDRPRYDRGLAGAQQLDHHVCDSAPGPSRLVPSLPRAPPWPFRRWTPGCLCFAAAVSCCTEWRGPRAPQPSLASPLRPLQWRPRRSDPPGLLLRDVLLPPARRCAAQDVSHGSSHRQAVPHVVSAGQLRSCPAPAPGLPVGLCSSANEDVFWHKNKCQGRLPRTQEPAGGSTRCRARRACVCRPLRWPCIRHRWCRACATGLRLMRT